MLPGPHPGPQTEPRPLRPKPPGSRKPSSPEGPGWASPVGVRIPGCAHPGVMLPRSTMGPAAPGTPAWADGPLSGDLSCLDPNERSAFSPTLHLSPTEVPAMGRLILSSLPVTEEVGPQGREVRCSGSPRLAVPSRWPAGKGRQQAALERSCRGPPGPWGHLLTGHSVQRPLGRKGRGCPRQGAK